MLRPGNVMSNEPGFYKKGKFGIRVENMIYVKKANKKTIFQKFNHGAIWKRFN